MNVYMEQAVRFSDIEDKDQGDVQDYMNTRGQNPKDAQFFQEFIPRAKVETCKGNPHFCTHYQFTTANLDSPGPVGCNASLPRTSPPAGPRPNRRPHVDAHLPDRLMYLYGLSRTLFLVRFLFGSCCSLALASH